MLRSLASAITLVYHRHATARSYARTRPHAWFLLVFRDDWIRYRDAALLGAGPPAG